MEHWWWILIGVGIIAVGILISGLITQCPTCNKLWSRKLKGKEEVKREGGYKTITRYDIKRDASGKEIGRTERQEQIHVIRVTYRNSYKCRNCRHTWSTLSTHEYEG